MEKHACRGFSSYHFTIYLISCIYYSFYTCFSFNFFYSHLLVYSDIRQTQHIYELCSTRVSGPSFWSVDTKITPLFARIRCKIIYSLYVHKYCPDGPPYTLVSMRSAEPLRLLKLTLIVVATGKPHMPSSKFYRRYHLIVTLFVNQ